MRKRGITAYLRDWSVVVIEEDEELHMKGGFILRGLCRAGEGKKLVEGEYIFTSRVLSHQQPIQLQQGTVVETVGGSLYMLGNKKGTAIGV